MFFSTNNTVSRTCLKKTIGRDSNHGPLNRESSTVTARPGPDPLQELCSVLLASFVNRLTHAWRVYFTWLLSLKSAEMHNMVLFDSFLTYFCVLVINIEVHKLSSFSSFVKIYKVLNTSYEFVWILVFVQSIQGQTFHGCINHDIVEAFAPSYLWDYPTTSIAALPTLSRLLYP